MGDGEDGGEGVEKRRGETQRRRARVELERVREFPTIIIYFILLFNLMTPIVT
jgi:hypothetical protein